MNEKSNKKILENVQKLGKALMLPIAVLPIAGILLALGQPHMLGIPLLAHAGDVLFSNLPLIFAIGIALGLAEGNDGAAGLAGAVAYFILNASAKATNYAILTGSIFGDMPHGAPEVKMAHFGGIIAGVIAGLCYNKFHDTKLPEWLAFFGGKRFVPIITGGFAILFGIIFGWIWPVFQNGLDCFARWMVISGGVGAFIYGALNRVLLPLGLHHVLNFFIWFNCGSYTKPDGTVVTGDLNRFFAGDPDGGMFTAGFYPIMMFAMPAIALAIYVCATKKNKPVVGGAMISVALTSFLTGITSPIEYLFMFSSLPLFIIHGILTGISVALCQVLGIRDSFTFSAGLIDYIMNFNKAEKAWLLIPIGLVVGVIYFIIFVFMIKKFNIPTPGRSDDEPFDGLDNKSK